MKVMIMTILAACSLVVATAQNSVTLSSVRGDVQKLIQTAQQRGAIAVIDRNADIRKTVMVQGDLILKGNPGVVLNNRIPGGKPMIQLGEGKHQISNLIIRQDPDGVAFMTEQKPNIIWTNDFDRVHVENGNGAYQSSRGGKENQWCITTWKNSHLRSGAVCIGVFSQDGPFKALHLQNMRLETGEAFGNHAGISGPSHTVYAHPNVSLDFDSVSMSAGKLGLHHFSGGGVPGSNSYVRMKKIFSPKNGIEIVSPGKGVVEIDSSDMGTFTTLGVPCPLVKATNSQFRNIGNGIFLRGTLINCTGGAWASTDGPLEIQNSWLNEIDMRVGGKVTIRGSTIANIWLGGRGNPFDVDVQESTINNVVITKPTGKIKADKKSTLKAVSGDKSIIRKE